MDCECRPQYNKSSLFNHVQGRPQGWWLFTPAMRELCRVRRLVSGDPSKGYTEPEVKAPGVNLLAEIDALVRFTPCFASNERLANSVGLSKRQGERLLGKMQSKTRGMTEKGKYIVTLGFYRDFVFRVINPELSDHPKINTEFIYEYLQNPHAAVERWAKIIHDKRRPKTPENIEDATPKNGEAEIQHPKRRGCPIPKKGSIQHRQKLRG
jgi:hypothetical protein